MSTPVPVVLSMCLTGYPALGIPDGRLGVIHLANDGPRTEGQKGMMAKGLSDTRCPGFGW